MYTALVLSDYSRTEILMNFRPPKDWEVICHHITLCMGVDEDFILPAKIGEQYESRVVAIGYTDKVIALKVTNQVNSKNKVKHITVAVNRKAGGKPVMSNDITEWKPVYNYLIVWGKIAVCQ